MEHDIGENGTTKNSRYKFLRLPCNLLYTIAFSKTICKGLSKAYAMVNVKIYKNSLKYFLKENFNRAFANALFRQQFLKLKIIFFFLDSQIKKRFKIFPFFPLDLN